VRKGFTLIELIVVIAIIAILAAIIAPNAFKAIEKAKISRTLGDYRSIKTAVMGFHVDTTTWPTDGCEESLATNNTCTAAGVALDVAEGIADWDGPYLESWPSPGAFGNMNFCNNADGSGTSPCSVDLTTTGEAVSRYLGLLGLEQEEHGKIEAALDDENEATGIVRRNATAPAATGIYIEGGLN